MSQENGQVLNATEQIAEAFQLGTVLARIETNLGHVGETTRRIDQTVTGMSERLGVLEIASGRQDEQLRTAFRRIEQLEERDSVAVDTPTRREFDDVKAEVAHGRLSWPKVGALLAGLSAGFVVVGVIDSWTPVA